MRVFVIRIRHRANARRLRTGRDKARGTRDNSLVLMAEPYHAPYLLLVETKIVTGLCRDHQHRTIEGTLFLDRDYERRLDPCPSPGKARGTIDYRSSSDVNDKSISFRPRRIIGARVRHVGSQLFGRRVKRSSSVGVT